MEDILGYVLSKALDVVVPGLRASWGNWGCLMVSILAAGILFWFVPAYVLDLPGDDWKTWLVVGPLATIVVVIMVSGTYGLTRGRGAEGGEPAIGGGYDGPEPGARDIEVLTDDIPESIQRYIHSRSKECPYCGATLNARAVMCRYCGRNVRRFTAESTVNSGGQGESEERERA
jgi:hypothetical protein